MLSVYECSFQLLHIIKITMAAATTVATPIPPPFFSPYLDDQSGKIQAKGVPWEVGFSLHVVVCVGICVYRHLTVVTGLSEGQATLGG